ncbi:MAG: PAS domain S-box protein, partial [Gammaproteobacteria bacterium]
MHQEVNGRSDPEFPQVADGAGISGKLLRSHLAVAAIGLGMLAVAFGSTWLLRSATLSLIHQSEPTVRASTRALAGLERSLGAVRGWEALGDPAFKDERAEAWNQEIDPAMTALKDLSRQWQDADDKELLGELITLLEKEKEEQWRIEDVARTPDNLPALLMFNRKVRPVADIILSAISGLIDQGKYPYGNAESRGLLRLLADIQGLFTRTEITLNDFVHTGSPPVEQDFRTYLHEAKQRINTLEAYAANLKPDQRELLKSIRTEFPAYELFGNQVVEIRKSDNWNVARHLMMTEAVPRARKAGDILRCLSQSQTKRMQAQVDYVTSISTIGLLLLLALIAAMTLAAWIVSRRGAERITKPLSVLSQATQKLAAGLLTEDIPVAGDDELARLTVSFNAMRASLQQSRSDLNHRNIELEQEIAERKRAENALHSAYDELEARVRQRTTDLADANEKLLSEISERKQAEDRFRLVVEGSPNALILVNRAGKIVLVNTQTEKFLGYERDELIGQPIEMLIPERFRSKHFGYLTDFFNEPQTRAMGVGRDLFALRKDGVEFPVEIGLNPIQMNNELLVLSVILDITERKQAERQLLILSNATKQSSNAILITDAAGNVEYANPRFTELTGYSADELIGRNPRLLRSGKTAPERYTRLWDTILAGGEWQGELQNRKKNGELYWVSETISPIRNSQGVIDHFLAIQQDITDQKRAETALQESVERFEQVADMTGEWIWEQDLSGHYIYSSAAVKQILGYEPEEIIGKSYIDLFTSEDREQWGYETPEGSRIKDDSFHLINHYLHKNGHEIFTESTGVPIHNNRGRLIKWRGVDRDITARKHFEDAVRLRDRAIEAASVGIVITDANQPNNPVIYVNSALSRMTGYGRDELLGHNMHMLQGHGSDSATIEEIRKAIQEERDCEVIIRNYRKDGTPFWNALLLSPVRDDRGQLINYIGVQTDVTKLREAEEQRYELEIAKQIQQSLLPQKSLHLKNVTIAGSCLPALNVGGDYFDYFNSQDAIDVVIADVSGHSVGAALIMAETRSILKMETGNFLAQQSGGDNGAATILSNLNDFLFEDLDRAELFITVFYIKYHPATGRLNYANAGHNCALLLRRDGDAC